MDRKPSPFSTAARAGIACALLAALAACSAIRPDFAKPQSTALAPETQSASARYIAAELAGHAGESGFRLLTRNNNALMSRIALVDHAQRSIDLQYYIFKNDETGRLLAQRLLAAAERGVRVRLLLDDIALSDEDRMLDALDAHPNFEVRLFNPFNTRNPSLLSKIGQFMLEGRRLNRRMHNKSFIVDGNVAVIGGRNIGNDYFDAGDTRYFRDLDVLAIGPVVAQASQVFDEYWNSEAAYPVTAFRGVHDTPQDLARLRKRLATDARAFAQSDYAQATLEQMPGGPTADRRGDWFWGPARLVADEPEKVDPSFGKDAQALRIGPTLRLWVDGAQHELVVITPYFVPGDRGVAYFADLVKRGVAVKVLTNSLASNDEAAVHAGYARYRRALLAAGVTLHELQPAGGMQQPATSGGTSSGVSLHAKAMVVDGTQVFIGSMNMDPRSRLLNTEMGLIIDSPGLARAVMRFYDTACEPENAFHVVLQEPASGHGAARMTWLWQHDGEARISHHDPLTTRTRRLEVSLMRLLPIDGLL